MPIPEVPPLRKHRPAWKSPWRWLAALVLTLAMLPVLYMLDLPYVPALRTKNPQWTTLMALRENQAKESGKLLLIQYQWKNLSEISPHLAHSVLLSEDDIFYQHHGFDLDQIEIAIKTDLEKKKFAYGGSTITQQLARSLFLSPSKNLFRKAKEAEITVLLERYLTKQRIMELYLNVIEWGPGIFGAEKAAQNYFHKPAKDLMPEEAVSLASILPSPRRWNPTSDKGFMSRRKNHLIGRLRREGFLPEEQPIVQEIPEEIQRMAFEANQFLQQQASQEQAPVADDAQSLPPQSGGGLYEPGHEQAPQDASQ